MKNETVDPQIIKHLIAHSKKYDEAVNNNDAAAVGTAGNEMWADGEWSLTVQGQNGPAMQIQGYWGAIKAREGDTWKTRFDVSTPRPAATGAATPSTTGPSNQ
jgi:hypothetical protein